MGGHPGAHTTVGGQTIPETALRSSLALAIIVDPLLEQVSDMTIHSSRPRSHAVHATVAPGVGCKCRVTSIPPSDLWRRNRPELR